MATLTNTGKSQTAGLINGLETSPFTYIALGSGSTEEASSDTELESEISTDGGERTEAGTISQTTTSTTDDTAHWEHTFNFNGNLTINEVGLFDSDSGGNMYMRHVLGTERNVTNGDTLTVTIDSVQSEGS